MNVFDFCIPAHLKFGVDVINRLGNMVNEITGDNIAPRVMLVTESVLHESGTIKRIKEILQRKGCEPIIFDDVVLNACSDVVDDGARRARLSHCNVIIGLGGVRALSIAKMIAVLANNEGDIMEFIEGKIAENQAVPYIEIPSTPRNPFMFKDEAWITDARNHNSYILNVPPNTTRFVVFDPMITTTLTRRLTATIAIDIFANAYEGYISSKANFLSDTLFMNAMGLISENIMPAVNTPNDMTARANISLAGFLTSLGLSMTSTGITASLSYVISSKFRLHKALASAIVLPHVMDYNINAAPEKYVKMAQCLGENTENLTVLEAALKAIEHIRKIILELQLPTRLDEFHINRDDLISLAEEARKFYMFNYIPRSCDTEELIAILQSSY